MPPTHQGCVKSFLVVSVMSLFLQSALSQISQIPELDIFRGAVWRPQRRPIMDIQPEEVSSHCKRNLSDLPKAFDAFGKPAAGILVGNINWMGHFDECVGLEGFQYCVVQFNISGMQGMSMLPGSYYGLCAPENCSESDVYLSMDFFIERTPELKASPIEVIGQPMCTQFPHRPIDGKFGVTVAFFCLLFALVVGSSLYHAWYHSTACRKSQNYHQDENGDLSQPDTSPLVHEADENTKMDANNSHIQTRQEGESLKTFNKIIFSWALPQNLPKLLSGGQTKGSIPCLHGIRVLSMLWVIIGHVVMFPVMFGTVNPLTGLSWLQRYNFMTIANAFFSVDSFFVLSGFLVTYLTLNQMKRKQGKIPWHWFYFHRYWRLTPAVAITMLFYVFITPYFGYGPYAQLLGVRQQCPKYWWSNLLYINNFYPTQSAQMCIGWVWYLANDMQFFVISPLILVPLYFVPWLGMALLATLCMISFTVTGTLVGVYDLSSGFFSQPNGNNFTDIIYMKPYCRITPYLVGMALGYIFYKYPKKSVKLHWIAALSGWIIASGIGYACVYSVFGNYNGHPFTKAENVVYEMFCRFAWGVFLSWVIFACHYGYGGWVNSLLSHPAWAPLSRLTFTTYLLHPIIIMLFLSFQGSPTYLSLGLLAFNFSGISLISFGCAAIFSLMVEFPLVGLEKMFLPRG